MKLNSQERKSLPDKCFTFIGVIDGEQHRKLPVFDESGTVMPVQLRAALRYLPKTILPSESIRREIHDKLENLLVKYKKNISVGKRTTYHGWQPVIVKSVIVKPASKTVARNPHEPDDTFDSEELMRLFNEFTGKLGKKARYSEYELYDAMEHCIRNMGARVDFKEHKYRNHLGKNWLKYLAEEEGRTVNFTKKDIIDSIYHAWDQRGEYENAKARLT